MGLVVLEVKVFFCLSAKKDDDMASKRTDSRVLAWSHCLLKQFSRNGSYVSIGKKDICLLTPTCGD